jgi:hypothetical protein
VPAKQLKDGWSMVVRYWPRPCKWKVALAALLPPRQDSTLPAAQLRHFLIFDNVHVYQQVDGRCLYLKSLSGMRRELQGELQSLIWTKSELQLCWVIHGPKL